jgi:hypothetical protein
MRRLHHHTGGDETPVRERLGFPCASACLDCGWLELPDRTRGDPMRSEAGTGGVPAHACPKCNRCSWIDLADVATSRAWVELERRRSQLRHSFTGAALTIATSVAVIVMVASAGLHPVLWFAYTSIAVVFASVGISRLRAALSSASHGSFRWHAPALRWSAAEQIASGPVTGEPLAIAPITGRPAIAWRIEVRHRGDRTGELALVEQSCPSELVVAGRSVAEPTLAVATETVTVDSAQARMYLRSRGIDPDDALVVREGLVQPTDVLVLRRDRFGGAPVLTSR